MAELMALMYLAYLTSLGAVWLEMLAAEENRSVSLAWNFCIGTILWGYVQFLLDFFYVQKGGAWLFFWQALLLLIPAVVMRGSVRPRLSFLVRPHGIAYLFVFLIGIAFLTSVLQALAFPMHLWDSIVIYGFKAKVLAHAQTFRTDLFRDPSILHFSADYPLLIPYIEAGYYRWLGYANDRTVRLLFLVYWAAWLRVLYEALAERIARDNALLLLGIIATLPLFSNIFMGQAVSGFADIPFALYWMAFLILGQRFNRSGSGFLALPLLALGCVFTKNEGLPAIVISGGLLYGQATNERRRDWWKLLAITLTLLLPWWLLRLELPRTGLHHFRTLDLSLAQIMIRLKMIGLSFWHECFWIKSWGLFWGLAGLGIMWPRRSAPFSRESRLCLFAIALQMLVYIYVFLVYPMDLALLLPVTIPRLLLHVIGPLTLGLGWRLASYTSSPEANA